MESLTSAQQELYDWIVEYIAKHQHAPSLRQMMQALGLKSVSSVAARLTYLKNKGYIEWSEGHGRTISCREDCRGLPILGSIAAGFVKEAFTDTVERLNFSGIPIRSDDFALKVEKECSFKDIMITGGDVVLIRPIGNRDSVQDGTAVVARTTEGLLFAGFYRSGDKVILKSWNHNSPTLELLSSQVNLVGYLIGVWREVDLDEEDEEDEEEKEAETKIEKDGSLLEPIYNND
ncbi:MAG: transcriptional repressor LexA [Spirulina sp.]